MCRRHVRSLRLLAVAAVGVVGLASCGSDSESSSDASTTTVTTVAPPTTSPALTTTAAQPTTTTAKPTTTAAKPSTTPPAPTTTTASGPVVIDVDADSGTVVRQEVPLGTDVEIRVVTRTPQEFHLHGFDLELSGAAVKFSFTADKTGEFELESHASDQVILVLTVV
jgi:cytoskeletal protein RodZ